MIKPKKIVAIGPHPDDLEIGCFGSLLKYYRQGAEIHLIILTSGKNEETKKVRERESKESAEHINAQVYFLGETDGFLKDNVESINFVEKIITEVDPDIVMIPNGNDTHQDHFYAHRIALGASRKKYNVFVYDTITSIEFKPNIYIGITNFVDEKIECLNLHKSQIKNPRDIETGLEHISGYFGYKISQYGKMFEGFELLRLIQD